MELLLASAAVAIGAAVCMGAAFGMGAAAAVAMGAAFAAAVGMLAAAASASTTSWRRFLEDFLESFFASFFSFFLEAFLCFGCLEDFLESFLLLLLLLPRFISSCFAARRKRRALTDCPPGPGGRSASDELPLLLALPLLPEELEELRFFFLLPEVLPLLLEELCFFLLFLRSSHSLNSSLAACNMNKVATTLFELSVYICSL